MLKSSRLKLFTTFLTLGVLTQLYQNCNTMTGFEIGDYENLSLASGAADTNHPGETAASASSQKMQTANREYVAQLMRENFTSANYPVSTLESLIHKWILNRPSQYGLACDPYSTWTGRDCGGDISGSGLSYTIDDNTVRQSYRVQFCDNILGIDNAVKAFTEKLSAAGAAPTASSIRQAIPLFYRGDVPNEVFVSTLVDFDLTLANKKETPLDRWRAVIMQICESPGWQLL